MVVLTIEHAPNTLLGELRRYMYEIRSGIYVGTISAKVRQKLWTQYIEPNQNLIATMIWTDTNEQGFSAMIHGEPRRKICKIDGLNVVTIGQQLNKTYFLAKTNTSKDLCAHLYETGIMAYAMCNIGLFKNIVHRICFLTKETTKNVINVISFLASVHDIGKIHPDFQINILNNQKMERFGIKSSNAAKCRHEQYGATFLLLWMEKQKIQKAEYLSDCIYTHHQGHSKDSYADIRSESKTKISLIGDEILNEMFNMFPFSQDIFIRISEGTNGLYSFISAMINFCDWAASSEEVFDEKTCKNFNTKDEYIAHLYQQAEIFIQKNYLEHISLSSRFNNVDDSFSEIFQITEKRPLQQTIYEITKQNTDVPSLVLVEDSCGAGKTESAFHLALKLNQNVSGIYMALPTSATSEAMQSRLQALIDAGDKSIKVPVYEGKAWLSDKDISLEKECWLHPSRQKLFYPFATGTVDQLIEAVQAVKYGLLRLLALSGKTIIIDEMHAYDAYMLRNLELLLTYCGWLGISVIVLSATLPERTKQRLLNAYAYPQKGDKIKSCNGDFVFKKQWPILHNYPLVSVLKYELEDIQCPNIEFHQYPCNPAFTKKYTYELSPILGQEQNKKIIEYAKQEIQNGGCLAIIMNTVKEASELFHALQTDEKLADTELLLVHAQCTLAKKEAITANLNRKFGKDRNKSQRPTKSIVVSTQIIEQSLDVDFDFLFTELCPIDLLLQRFGRYRRHDDKGTVREKHPVNNSIKIFIPENETTFGASEKIYSKEVLSQTLQVLKELSDQTIQCPENVRFLIDSVYQNSILNLLDEHKQENKAIEKLLPSPYETYFEFYQTCLANNFTFAETRLSSYIAYDIAIVDKKLFNQLEQLSGNQSVDIQLAKRIMKENTIYGVGQWRLKDKNGDLFDDKIHIHAGMLKGYLNSVDIYCADDDGIVHGNGISMTIHEGELIFGL